MTIDERIAAELRRHAPEVDEHAAWDRIRSAVPARRRGRARVVGVGARTPRTGMGRGVAWAVAAFIVLTVGGMYLAFGGEDGRVVDQPTVPTPTTVLTPAPNPTRLPEVGQEPVGPLPPGAYVVVDRDLSTRTAAPSSSRARVDGLGRRDIQAERSLAALTPSRPAGSPGV